MDKLQLQLVDFVEIVGKYPDVKLAYFFGSRALGTATENSDYDFAVYLDQKDARARYEMRLRLISDFSTLLGTDEVDLLVINDLEMPALKFSIISEGILFYEQEPFKLLVEPKIMSEHCDLLFDLRKYNLTKA